MAESLWSMTARIIDLLVGLRASAWGQIKQGPQRLDGSQVSRMLPWIAWRIDQLACPVQADRAISPPLEDGQNRNRLAIRTIASIVPPEAVVRGRQQSDVLPPFVVRERRDPLDGGLGDNRQVAAQPFKMGHRTPPHVNERRAGRTRPLLQRQFRGNPTRGTRPSILGVAREHVMVNH